MQNTDAKIRYVALGDSYSNGEGETSNDAWPVLLTNHLKKEGHDIEFVANPSVSGFTTQNLIDEELPVFIKARPTFATVLIGANDLFQDIDKKILQTNFVTILDKMQEVLPDKQNIVVLTIPDYSVSPQARLYKSNPQEQNKIIEFNEFIKKEAERRKLSVVDLFDLAKAMGEDDSLVTTDGLHPSAKELKLWEEIIYPIVDKLFREQIP